MASKLSEQQIFDILLESDVEGMSDDEDDMEEQIGLDLEEETTSELFDEEEPSIPEVLQQTQNRKFKWFSKNFTNSSDCPDELEWDVENRQMWTPYNYFCEYFNDDFWSLVSEKSNMYAHQNNNKKLVGAHIIAGCMKLPRIRMYYRPQIKVPAITQIPRDRFLKFRNEMHFVDNMSVTEEDKKDKLWRIRPVLDVLLGKCRSIPKPNKCSIDEQMIPFSGKTSLKQYVKGIQWD